MFVFEFWRGGLVGWVGGGGWGGGGGGRGGVWAVCPYPGSPVTPFSRHEDGQLITLTSMI